MTNFLGIDIGAEKTRIGVGDRNGLDSDVHVIDTEEYWSEEGLVELAKKKIDHLLFYDLESHSIRHFL